MQTFEEFSRDRKDTKIDKKWHHVEKDYKIIGSVGSGRYGKVIKAKCKETGKNVAIKLIEDIFEDFDQPRHVIRELQILHELTQMPNNIFTVKIVDVILPITDKRPLRKFKDIFFVMEHVKLDVLSLFAKANPNKFTEEHLICIMYNTLCALNYLDSANIMHRDLKPDNILISDSCGINICDFGFARSFPNDQS